MGSSGALTRIDITGRNGIKLAEKWEKEVGSYMGFAIHGFPNMFIITGPGSPSVKSNMVMSIEQHVELIGDTIAYLRSRNLGAIEATAEAERSWMQHVSDIANKTLFVKADSWYNGTNVPGKARGFVIYVGGVNNYRLEVEDMVADGYRGMVLEPVRSAQEVDA